jgi:hypothetical protein
MGIADSRRFGRAVGGRGTTGRRPGGSSANIRNLCGRLGYGRFEGGRKSVDDVAVVQIVSVGVVLVVLHHCDVARGRQELAQFATAAPNVHNRLEAATALIHPLGDTLVPRAVSGLAEVESAFEASARDNDDAVFVQIKPVVFENRRWSSIFSLVSALRDFRAPRVRRGGRRPCFFSAGLAGELRGCCGAD